METRDAPLIVETERTIRADPSRLKQLLENLISNAVIHGEEPVTVTIGDLTDGFYVADNEDGFLLTYGLRCSIPGTRPKRTAPGVELNTFYWIAEAHGWEIRITDTEHGGARDSR